MFDQLINRWWIVAARGTVAVAFGVMAFLSPDKTLTFLVSLFGIFAIADGIFTIGAGLATNWLTLFLEGVVGGAIGLLTVLFPAAAQLWFVYLIVAWAFVTGALELSGAYSLRKSATGPLQRGEWLLGCQRRAFAVVRQRGRRRTLARGRAVHVGHRRLRRAVRGAAAGAGVQHQDLASNGLRPVRGLGEGALAMQTRWTDRYARRTQSMRSSLVRELLKLTAQPDLISFAGACRPPTCFPSTDSRRRAGVFLASMGARRCRSSATEGEGPLRELIARHTSRYGIAVAIDNVLVTTGSQQALDLIGKVFINPGDRVVVERPTYLGALQAWNAYGPNTCGDVDRGRDLHQRLAAAFRRGPKFIYTLPNFQNPTGMTLSLERVASSFGPADEYGVPILEEDPYGQLRYKGEHLPPLVALDAESALQPRHPMAATCST